MCGYNSKRGYYSRKYAKNRKSQKITNWSFVTLLLEKRVPGSRGLPGTRHQQARQSHVAASSYQLPRESPWSCADNRHGTDRQAWGSWTLGFQLRWSESGPQTPGLWVTWQRHKSRDHNTPKLHPLFPLSYQFWQQNRLSCLRYLFTGQEDNWITCSLMMYMVHKHAHVGLLGLTTMCSHGYSSLRGVGRLSPPQIWRREEPSFPLLPLLSAAAAHLFFLLAPEFLAWLTPFAR